MKLKIAYDDNLGLPKDFASALDCETIAYHDVSQIIKTFEDGAVYAVFVPAGTLPYMKNYTIIAQAIFKNSIWLQSNFVSTKKINTSEVPQLVLGRVNQYCTTSFWAPLIHLKDQLPRGTMLNFKNAKGFQDLLHQTAEATIDCSMVWNIIMEQNPTDSSKVEELFLQRNLPTPVMVISSNEEVDNQLKLNEFVTTDKKAFFPAFQSPDTNSLNNFIGEMKAVSEYFKIRIVT